ncbi:MAG: hypothetical protein ACI9FN_003361 [Saprospiraceae bacterium]|jgi:hypothetical protein
MMIKYAIGIIGITGLMILWAMIQYLWRIVFMDQQTDEDVLAGRSSCGNCGCGTPCEKKRSGLKN